MRGVAKLNSAAMSRDVNIDTFIGALQAAFASARGMTPEAAEFAYDLFHKLTSPAPKGMHSGARLPVCQFLPSALQAAKKAPRPVSELAAGFALLAPSLAWKLRSSGGPHASENWLAGHANAVIIGEGGLEERRDIAVGASLLAPNVRYPDHTHPPEELYMILSPGRFQHGEEAWCEPGPGGTFHNAPGIKHAMASGNQPLLAIWTMIIR